MPALAGDLGPQLARAVGARTWDAVLVGRNRSLLEEEEFW